MLLADRVVVMSPAPGRVVDVEDTLRLWATNAIATPLPDGAVTVVPPVAAFATRVDGHELELVQKP